MKIRVLFFGATADLVGKREVDASVSDAASPVDVVQTLVADHPGLGIRRLLFAVNEEYVPATAQLKDGDDLAIFTPVSGG
jgi:molybdopterin converting factor small subunit